MEQDTVNEILRIAKVHPARAVACYIFGSRVYGTHNHWSDTDVKLVYKGIHSGQEIKRTDFNIHLISEQDFQRQLKEHLPGPVECIMAPQEFRWEKSTPDFRLSIPSLRHMFSHTSSNSWVKARKKLEQGDYETGIKSLFHALRIPMFGTQLATTGRITDFSCANHIMEELRSRTWTWEELDERFRPDRNRIMTDFRKVTVK